MQHKPASCGTDSGHSLGDREELFRVTSQEMYTVVNVTNILFWYEACGMTRKFRTSSSSNAPIPFHLDEGGMRPDANTNCRCGMHTWVWLVNKCNFSGSFTAMQQAAAFDRCTVRTCCLNETQKVISRSRSTCTRNPSDFRIPLLDFTFSQLISPMQALFINMLSACRVHCVQ